MFIKAEQALENVVDQIRDDQWGMPMPPDFVMRRTDRTVTLREIINYHAYDDAWVPDMLAGRTMDEARRDKYDGDLLGDDPKVAFAGIVRKAVAAAEALADADLDRIAHLSFRRLHRP